MEATSPPVREREVVEACPVCGSPDRTTGLPDADVVQCTACDVLYVSPRPTAAAIATFYSQPNRYAHWDAQSGRAAMWQRRLARVRRLAPSGRLLDVGTGQGDFGAAARQYFEFEGTEISSEGVRVGRERHNLAIHQGDLIDLALPGNRFDLVTLWHVLEHVGDPRALAAECVRVLRPGGVLAVAVPNADEHWQLTRRLWSNALQFALKRPPRHDCRVPLVDHGLGLLLGRMPLRDITIERLDLTRLETEVHLTHFTLDTLARLLHSIGLHVVERGIDDHSPDDGVGARLAHRRQRALYALTERAAANAIFAAARKPG
jgi:SAM-dependent methyltransferase